MLEISALFPGSKLIHTPTGKPVTVDSILVVNEGPFPGQAIRVRFPLGSVLTILTEHLELAK